MKKNSPTSLSAQQELKLEELSLQIEEKRKLLENLSEQKAVYQKFLIKKEIVELIEQAAKIAPRDFVLQQQLINDKKSLKIIQHNIEETAEGAFLCYKDYYANKNNHFNLQITVSGFRGAVYYDNWEVANQSIQKINSKLAELQKDQGCNLKLAEGLNLYKPDDLESTFYSKYVAPVFRVVKKNVAKTNKDLYSKLLTNQLLLINQFNSPEFFTVPLKDSFKDCTLSFADILKDNPSKDKLIKSYILSQTNQSKESLVDYGDIAKACGVNNIDDPTDYLGWHMFYYLAQNKYTKIQELVYHYQDSNPHVNILTLIETLRNIFKIYLNIALELKEVKFETDEAPNDSDNIDPLSNFCHEFTTYCEKYDKNPSQYGSILQNDFINKKNDTSKEDGTIGTDNKVIATISLSKHTETQTNIYFSKTLIDKSDPVVLKKMIEAAAKGLCTNHLGKNGIKFYNTNAGTFYTIKIGENSEFFAKDIAYNESQETVGILFSDTINHQELSNCIASSKVEIISYDLPELENIAATLPIKLSGDTNYISMQEFE